MSNVCSTVILLLFTFKHHVQSVACACHTLWILQILEDMRHLGRWFCRRVKFLNVGYTACSVNEVLYLANTFGLVIAIHNQVRLLSSQCNGP